MHKAQRLINHVALVLDGSSSMQSHTRSLVKVADEQIRYLAKRSDELNQETRVSVYLFGSYVECLLFDMDVMRLPSIADLYRANGMTALIDATMKSQDDLATTSQIYGDHAFLTFVLTDGMENYSREHNERSLTNAVSQAGENWSLAFLVPDRSSSDYVRRLGVSDGNIAIWNTASATGITEAVSQIRTATETFMQGRAKGVRGSRSVFSTGIDAVNYRTVSEALTPLDKSEYVLYDVTMAEQIRDCVARVVGRYAKGKAYYQLTKREEIQPQKELIVVDKRTGVAYAGKHARDLVGLKNQYQKVRPDANPKYDIYVQSTSVNRKLVPGTKVLIRS